MNISSKKTRWHLGRTSLAVAGLAAAILASSACTHIPDGEDFVRGWKVANVIQDADDPTPANVGGEFRIVRESDTTFRVEPGANFSQFNDQWAALEFRHQCGRGKHEPISVRERLLSTGKRDKRGFVLLRKEIINDLYNELSIAGIQSLVGGPLKIHDEDHTLHFFLFNNPDEKRSYDEEELLIFFCHKTHCNHNGMIHSRPN